MAENLSGGLPRKRSRLKNLINRVVRAAVAPLKYPKYYANNFVAAASYTRGRRGHRIKYIVIHDMESSYASAVSWFRNPNAGASAHYCLRKDGFATQMVSESNTAWHAGNWQVNLESVAIEHEGYASRRDTWTDEMLHTSAKISAGICLRYGIPADRQHIFGHSEVYGATHTDPGPYFPWKEYIRLVRYYMRGPDSGGNKLYHVQVGAFNSRKNAENLARRLKADGFDAYIKHEGFYRVQVGAFSHKEYADTLARKLRAKGYPVYIRRS